MKAEEQVLVRRGDHVQNQKVVREGQQTPPPNPCNIFTLIKFTISKITKNRQCTSTGKQNYPSDPPGKISGSMHGGVPYLSAFKWKSYMNT